MVHASSSVPKSRPRHRAAKVSDAYHGKVEAIAQELRRQITDGTYLSGARLPTRAELTLRYDVSNLTVQRALDRLTNDGFAVPRGRAGTFVAERLPHQSHYALLFPTKLSTDSNPNLFWLTLAECAKRVSRDGIKVSIIEGFAGRDGFDGYARLLQDVQADRVAGLIFASDPAALRDTPLVRDSAVCKTGFMSRIVDGTPVVNMDAEHFLTMAGEHLRKLGKRRVAVIVVERRDINFAQTVRRVLHGLGLECPDHAVLAASLEKTEWVSPLVKLLWSLPKNRRPDGLILTDQNHVVAALAGLKQAGCRVGRDLSIVAHCNFPLVSGEDEPVQWLGYDIDAGLRQCMKNIDDLRAGRTPHLMTRLSARFASP
jgi:DNA-binding LacI/PurR family transcriptional regulator